MSFPRAHPMLPVAVAFGLLLASGRALAIGATAPSVDSVLPASGSVVPPNFHLFPVGDGLDGQRHLVHVRQGEATLFELETVPARGGGRVVELVLPQLPSLATLQIEGAVDSWESGAHWQLELETSDERDDEPPAFRETLRFSACVQRAVAGVVRVAGSFEPAVENDVAIYRLYQVGSGGRRDVVVTLAAGAPAVFLRDIVSPAPARDCYVLQAVDLAGNESSNEESCFDFEGEFLAPCSPDDAPLGKRPGGDPVEGGTGCSAGAPAEASLLAAALALAASWAAKRRSRSSRAPSARPGLPREVGSSLPASDAQRLSSPRSPPVER